jgi:XTP/dITP diphosphohydrolase
VRAVLCSRNAGKARELERLLEGVELELLEADEYPPETGSSYYENALAKARHGRAVGDRAAWMIGEDSGIEVQALDGRPGINSARAGGDDPVGWLLGQLEGAENRLARYVCELVALSPGGVEVRGTGMLHGSIATEARGSEGFGYDPIFIPEGATRTVAELGDEWKARNSHRARAATELRARLQSGANQP